MFDLLRRGLSQVCQDKTKERKEERFDSPIEILTYILMRIKIQDEVIIIFKAKHNHMGGTITY